MPTESPDDHTVLPASRFDQPYQLKTIISSSKTIPIRILLLSDTHAQRLFKEGSPLPYREPLPNADLLIHAGDLTQLGRHKEHLITYNTIASHPAPVKIIIPGNHDLSLDEEYFVKQSKSPRGIPGPIGSRETLFQECMDLWTSKEARSKGIILCVNEGVQEVKVKAAVLKIYTTPYTPSFCNWAFGFFRPEDGGVDRFSAIPKSRIPDDVDILVSHGPPYGVLDKVNPRKPYSVGCESLLAAVRRVKPILHVFGHIHEGYGVQRVNWSKESGRGAGDVWNAGNVDMLDGVYGDEARDVNWIDVRKQEEIQDSAGYGLDLIIDGPELKRGQETLFVNAAIMTRRGQPRHSPWVVDLNIPVQDDELVQKMAESSL